MKDGDKCPSCKDGIVRIVRGGGFSPWAEFKCNVCEWKQMLYDNVSMMLGFL